MYNMVKDRADTDTLKAQAYTALYNAQQSSDQRQNNYNYFILIPSSSDLDMARAKLALAQGQVGGCQARVDPSAKRPGPERCGCSAGKGGCRPGQCEPVPPDRPVSGTVTEADQLVGDQVSPGTTGFRID